MKWYNKGRKLLHCFTHNIKIATNKTNVEQIKLTSADRSVGHGLVILFPGPSD